MRARFFYHVKAVDLRSSHGFVLPSVEAHNELYQAALPDIAEVLRSVCKRFKLPLALTWAPCLNQGKSGCLETRDCTTRITHRRLVKTSKDGRRLSIHDYVLMKTSAKEKEDEREV
ncbi:hypothetical protein V6N12_020456 [Hibiscus sabdariffa]|uniref:NLP1-9 GAF domain-containing protein n=1 Tax=Hibiscus sabdariffa TaxID=183260 RepID=A0ABR2D0T8_9ROSI